MNRAAPAWPGSRNLRDLGGLALADGGVTAHGRVYRSAAREYLTDAGWAAARAAGLRTVVDLRNAPLETRPAPDHATVAPDATDGVTVVAAPTEDPEDAEFLAVCGPWLDHPRSWADNARLAPDRLAAVMRAIAAARPAVLLHCSGGRDRTGMVSAMLLRLADATDDAIRTDYADGWRGAGSYAGHAWVYDTAQRTWTSRHRPAVPEPDLERQLADRLPALTDWLTGFDLTGHLTAIGLSGQELDTLRSLLRP